MLTTEQIRRDVKQLTARAIEQLTDGDLRRVAWLTAALPGPVKAPGDLLAAHVATEKMAFQRKTLIRKLQERDALAARKAEMADLLPADVDRKIADLEVELDQLATAVLDAEE